MASKRTIRTSQSVHLDQKFWSNFSKNHWQKKPLAIENFQSSLQKLDESEVFRLLVSYSDQCRQNKCAEGFKFFIQGLQTNESDVLQVLPVKKDKNLLGYHKRMEKLFSDYCLVCDELLKVNSEQQAVLTDFTDELYRHVGFPNRFSEIGLYLGNYQKTPFGVHEDHCGVFSFPVVGQKKFRLWTSEFVQKNPMLNRAFKYEKYKKQSLVMVAKPGDMTYWPSSAWHIAESDGSFSATWSLGVWVDRSHKQMFSDGLNEILTHYSGASDEAVTTVFNNLHESTGEVLDLPAAFIESIQNLQKVSAIEMQESFLIFWMKHISLKGFKSISKSHMKLGLDTKIRLRNDRAKILWHKSLCEKNKFYFCFGGVCIHCLQSNQLLDLIRALNSGQVCLVRNFLTGTNQNRDLKFLKIFIDAGAIA